MTKEEAVILSAYTGYLLLDDFGAVHEFIEKLLGRPVFTHQLADPALAEEIRKECKPILPDVSEDVNRWIPVTERLPENDTRVLICYEDQVGNKGQDTDRVHGNRWIRYGRHVTHWMPLPEPPKEA